MKTILNKFIVCFTLLSVLVFTSCNDSKDDLDLELSIQQKLAVLQTGDWLLKGFEDRVMHTFSDGKRFTFYGTENIFSDIAIPGTQAYTISGELLTLDFNFGNVKTYEVIVSCENNIVEFYEDGELNATYFKKDSNYKDCL